MSWDDHMDDFDDGRKMLMRTYGFAGLCCLAGGLYYAWEFWRIWRTKF